MNVEGGSLTAGVAWIGICQICRNRSELQHFENFELCEECVRALQKGAGTLDRGQQGQLDARAPAPAPAPIVATGSISPAATAVSPTPDSDERSRYLASVKRADAKTIDRIIRRLVRERVFHVEFDQVVENPRWFSLMDLRRLALEVEMQECKITKQRSRKCQTRRQTRTQHPLKRPQPQEHPPQELLPL